MKRVRGRVIAAGMVLIAVAYFGFAPRQFGFVGDFGGRRIPLQANPSPFQLFLSGESGLAATDLDRQRKMFDAYVFTAGSDRVLGAMMDELESCGWKVEAISPAGDISLNRGVVNFRKSVRFGYLDRKAFFTDLPGLVDRQGRAATCEVIVPHAQSWFFKTWRSLKNPF